MTTVARLATSPRHAELQPFQFEDFALRTFDAGPADRWFLAAEVCQAVGITNPTMAVSRLDDDEKSALNSIEGFRGPVNVVNTAGLNTLIMTGRLRKDHPSYERVKRIRRWVCHDVLPSIYATGRYEITPEHEPTGMDLMIRQAKQVVAILERQADMERRLAAQEERAIDQTIAIQDARIAAEEAKVTAQAAVDSVSGGSGWMTLLGYCKINGLSFSTPKMAALGGHVSKLCRSKGIEPHKVYNEIFGETNSYPLWVLDEWAAARET